MNLIDRIRLALLRRRLAEVLAEDHADRDPARTTADMAVRMDERAGRIVRLQNKIRAITGEPEPAPDDGDDVPATPSSLFIPTKNSRHLF